MASVGDRVERIARGGRRERGGEMAMGTEAERRTGEEGGWVLKGEKRWRHPSVFWDRE